MVPRLIQLMKMRKNAHAFRIDFKRRSTFKTPKYISGGRKVLYPEEKNVKYDFFGIFIEDCYRLLRVKRLSRVLDIGANLGFFSMASKVIFPNALVHSYEPNFSLAEYLEPNKREFGFEVFYEAVGGHSGFVNLQTNGDSNQTRVFETDAVGVPKISIDNAIERMGGDRYIEVRL